MQMLGALRTIFALGMVIAKSFHEGLPNLSRHRAMTPTTGEQLIAMNRKLSS
jgi:hypothetical protein